MAAVIVLAGVLAGCSGDDGSDTLQPSAGSTAAVESPVATPADGSDEGSGEGSGDDTAAGGTSVDGVSVPLAPAAEAVATTASGPVTVVQFTVPADQQEATIAFYDSWTQAAPDEYQRTESDSGGVTWQNGPDAAEHAIIAVLSPLAGTDFAAVTLTVGPVE